MQRLIVVSGLLICLGLFVQSSLHSELIRENDIEDIEITVSSIEIDVSVDGETFWITVSTSYLEPSWNFGGYEFRISFYNEVLEYLDISTTNTIAEHAPATAFFENPAIPRLTVSWFSLISLVGEGPIVNLQFQAISNGTSSLNITFFRYSDGGPPLEYLTNINQGQVVVSGFQQAQVITPTFDPLPGNYTEPQLITITSETLDSYIYYTIDGEEPDENSTLFIDPVMISEDTIIKAKGYKSEYLPSETSIGYYYIETLSLPAPDNVNLILNDPELILSWDMVEGANLFYIYGSEDPFADDWSLLAVVLEGTSWVSSIVYAKFFFRIAAAYDDNLDDLDETIILSQ